MRIASAPLGYGQVSFVEKCSTCVPQQTRKMPQKDAFKLLPSGTTCKQVLLLPNDYKYNIHKCLGAGDVEVLRQSRVELGGDALLDL